MTEPVPYMKQAMKLLPGETWIYKGDVYTVAAVLPYDGVILTVNYKPMASGESRARTSYIIELRPDSEVLVMLKTDDFHMIRVNEL